MKVLDPGHLYELDVLDAPDLGRPFVVAGVRLQFVKREGDKYPGNVGHHPGTTTQEVLRALIDRTKYVNKQIPSAHNGYVLDYLRSAIFELELRAAERHGRRLELTSYQRARIETMPTCDKCGHIGCEGECH